MISEHFDAVEARLEADTDLAGRVHDTVRLDANGGLIRDQYVILYRSVPESIVSGRFNMIPEADSDVTFMVDVRAVGTSPKKCGAVMDRILTQLVGHRLVVAGRSCAPLVLDSSSRIVADQLVKQFMYYADVGFELTSRPA